MLLGCPPACPELALAAQSRRGANVGSPATRQGGSALFCGVGAAVTAAPGRWFRGSAQTPFCSPVSRRVLWPQHLPGSRSAVGKACFQFSWAPWGKQAALFPLLTYLLKRPGPSVR